MYKIEKVDVYVCKCFFCSHDWKAFNLPLRCAKCKRPGWDKDNKTEEISVGERYQKDKAISDLVLGSPSNQLKHSDNCVCFLCQISKGLSGKSEQKTS